MKDSFILFSENQEQIDMLSDEQAGVLFKAIFAYASDKALPEMDALTKMAFSFMRAAMDRTDERYQKRIETNRENGRLGGRPPKKSDEKTETETEKPNGFFQNPPEPDPVPVRDPVPERGVYSAPAREDTTGLEKFIERWGINATGMDNYSAGKASGTDWEAVSARVEKSAYLQQQKSLTFYIRHAGEILEGYYDDFVRPPNPPNERNGPRTSIYDAEGLAKMAEYDRIMERNEQRRRQRAQSGGKT